jgi:hypothetical protein
MVSKAVYSISCEYNNGNSKLQKEFLVLLRRTIILQTDTAAPLLPSAARKNLSGFSLKTTIRASERVATGGGYFKL